MNSDGLVCLSRSSFNPDMAGSFDVVHWIQLVRQMWSSRAPHSPLRHDILVKVVVVTRPVKLWMINGG